MKRIFLFVLTNLAVMLVISITLRLLGVDRVLDQSGAINFNALLVMSLVVGFSGSIISLFMSKWSAKRMVDAQVITTPSDPTERWLVETVRRQALAAGIGMPEVAIYDAPDVNAFATGWNKNNALVAVSTGLLHNMGRDETEAVLAHEISHVANGDMVTLALIQGVVAGGEDQQSNHLDKNLAGTVQNSKKRRWHKNHNGQQTATCRYGNPCQQHERCPAGFCQEIMIMKFHYVRYFCWIFTGICFFVTNSSRR